MSRHARSGRGFRPAHLVGAGALCLALAAGARASEAPAETDAPAKTEAHGKQVTWTLYTAAPYMITDGPQADGGIADRVRHILMKRLDDYAHHTINAPFPRVVSALKQGADWCFVGGVRTPEREAFAYFSRPTGMFYPLRIMVREGQRARFEALAPLSLRSLLAEHPDLRTSILRNRSMGPAIDPILRDAGAPQLHSEFDEAFRMFQNGRLDYLVEYADIAAYYAAALGEPRPWVGLSLAEDPEPVFSRVMCSRTPWGRAVIDRIDAVLSEVRPTAEYRRIIEAWSAPEDLPKLRAVYDSSFLSSE
ncbi:hypothetical protein ASF49_14965 [Methylobacterium sp. Leaf104]|uniref:transporter substrate-binding domain-containing protein n=1 Tax=Methylobacterium TaxID=407 RepID=UPI0006F8645F|nr:MULTISPECIES: transporter substrate-binding domain-containing protein [Methylobacterium]KQP29970.1 hypothetical protein ASF49_14965 [Methylobacterium sp. Leaf104]MCI9882329.1 transporter substrate-binding domain-containing protein [Methylobacterium goesingense]